MKKHILYIFGIIALALTACSTMKLSPVNYAWPVESVLKVNEKGVIEDSRFSLIINVKGLYFAEKGDSTQFVPDELRLIRNDAGYYFITGKTFKNVYVFSSDEAALELENTILINESGISNPAFNQRSGYVELLDGTAKYQLDNNGIKGK